MRQVNIKELKKNLSRELQDLPFEITKFGRVVGVVSEKGSHLDNKKVVTTPKKKKKGSHKLIDNPWVNPLTNTALAPKEQII